LLPTGKLFVALLLGVALMFGGWGCSPDNNNESLSLTDHAGRKVTINGEPQRIISLVPSHTEILYALGVGDKLVGVDDYSDYPVAALDVDKVGNLFAVNYEVIVGLNPDLILVDISAVPDVVDQLENVLPGKPVVVVKGTSIGSFQEVYDTIEMIGQVTDTTDKANDIITDMQARVKAVTDKTDGLSEAQKPRTVYMIWHDPIFVHGGHSLGSALIEAAGGINIFAENEGSAVQLEELIDRDPQVILASASETMGDFAYQFALGDERLETTTARINGDIFGMNDDLTGRPGPRLIEGLEEMAKILHQDLFE
jgi:iron complex transport system substrate-binding protein